MPTEMELTLEQTQQGVSYEVSLVDNEKVAVCSSIPILQIKVSNIRVNSFTIKIEILLEPTSNMLMVDESNTHVLERFYTSAGNSIKEILLKIDSTYPQVDPQDFEGKLKNGGMSYLFPLTHQES
ncbi:hypothetical protein Tco_0090183 [Tanacetum coccineum]